MLFPLRILHAIRDGRVDLFARGDDGGLLVDTPEPRDWAASLREVGRLLAFLKEPEPPKDYARRLYEREIAKQAETGPATTIAIAQIHPTIERVIVPPGCFPSTACSACGR